MKRFVLSALFAFSASSALANEELAAAMKQISEGSYAVMAFKDASFEPDSETIKPLLAGTDAMIAGASKALTLLPDNVINESNDLEKQRLTNSYRAKLHQLLGKIYEIRNALMRARIFGLNRVTQLWEEILVIRRDGHADFH